MNQEGLTVDDDDKLPTGYDTLPKLTAAQKQELDEATEAWGIAARHLQAVVEKLNPFKVGDRLPEWVIDDDMMEVEVISVAVHGSIHLTGRQLTKTGKKGRRLVSRHINLHHLDVEG